MLFFKKLSSKFDRPSMPGACSELRGTRNYMRSSKWQHGKSNEYSTLRLVL